MSFLANFLIGLIEKELASQTPEIEQYVASLIGQLAAELLQYVEKKSGIQTQAAQAPIPAQEQAPTS